LTAFSILCACSGSPGGGLPTQATVASGAGSAESAARSTKGRHARAELRVKIPRKHRGPHYVSASTQSIVVFEGAKQVGSFNTSATSPGCSPDGNSTLCTFEMGLIPGANQLFTIDAFDAAGGAGNLLSTGTLVETIQTGFNIFSITLAGVPASIQLALEGSPPDAGSPATQRLAVMASDADGNVIVGAGAYQHPVTLSSSDATGTVTVSPTTVTRPDQKVTVTYSGASIESATISASASGVAPGNVSAAIFAPTPTAIEDYQVQVRTGHRIAVAKGRKPHTRPAQDPTVIIAGPDGNLWIAVANTVFGLIKLSPSGTQQAFVGGGSDGLPAEAITGLTVSSDGLIWYVDSTDVGYVNPVGDTVTNYPLGGASLCAGSQAQSVVGAPATDPSPGSVWIAVQCASGSQIAHVTHGGTIVTYTLTGFVLPEGMIVGKDGNLYIAGQDATTGDAEVAQIGIAGGVASAPNLLDIAAVPEVNLVGIAQSADGDFWATTGSCVPSAFIRLHPNGSTITSWPAPSVFTTTNCSQPYFLIALADGTLWAADNAFAGVTRVTPGVYPAAPAQYEMLLPSPPTIQGREYGVALGSDGDLYFTDAASTTVQTGDVAKVAY